MKKTRKTKEQELEYMIECTNIFASKIFELRKSFSKKIERLIIKYLCKYDFFEREKLKKDIQKIRLYDSSLMYFLCDDVEEAINWILKCIKYGMYINN